MGATEGARLAAGHVEGEDIVLQFDHGVVVVDGAPLNHRPGCRRRGCLHLGMGVFLGIKRTAIVARIVVEEDIPTDFRPGEVFTENGPAITATLGLVAHEEVVKYARPGRVQQADGSTVG